MIKRQLKVFSYVDGGEGDTPFPNTGEQMLVNEYTYSSSRIGDIPKITGDVLYPENISNMWEVGVQYVDYKGQRLFLMQTPSLSRSNNLAGF